MKYRQPGYQGKREEPKEKAPPRPKPQDTFGPRVLNMPAKRNLSRCSQCGTILADLAQPLGKCVKCGFELHSCKQCSSFDPGSRFECMQPVPERIAQKDAANTCRYYQIRVMVERETTSGRPASPPTSSGGGSSSRSSSGGGGSTLDNARRAFDNLFNK